MSIIQKRLITIAASTLVLSLVSASANAQFDVFSNVNLLQYGVNGTSISTYTFNSSMILNSIDFGTTDSSLIKFSNLTLSYQIGSGEYQTVDNSLLGAVDAKGYQRIYLGELNVAAGTDVKVRIQGNHNIAADYAANAASNVTYVGSNPDFGNAPRFYNSNLRVYNPGSTVPGASVAPEPGSFALAVTGGATLIGICVRRRRNAG
ncbi:MAG: hypothetical protein ACOVP2_01890 [Armatimonadaceae bacterium]